MREINDKYEKINITMIIGTCLRFIKAVVLLYGDTNSILAGGLAARRLKLPIANIEDGLINYDKNISVEYNRIVIDQISTYLYVPNTHNFSWIRYLGKMIKEGKFILLDQAKMGNNSYMYGFGIKQ